MFIENLRIGGMGFSGSMSRDAVVNNVNYEAKYSIGGGAVTIEYTLPFIKKIAVSVGTLIGGGVLEIDLYQNSGSFNWNNLWQEFSSGQTNNISHKIQNKFFTLAPTINADIPVTRFIALRIGGGYLFSIGDNWEIDNAKTIGGVPSGLNGNSFFIQTGVFLGFFAF